MTDIMTHTQNSLFYGVKCGIGPAGDDANRHGPRNVTVL